MQPYPDFNDSSGKSSTPLAPFLIGAVLGAGIALLLAPAHGRETRRRVGDTVKRLGGNARQALEHTREGVNDFKHDAKAAFEKGRQEYMRHRKPEVESGTRPTQTPAI
jgi:gas vesicle protein